MQSKKHLLSVWSGLVDDEGLEVDVVMVLHFKAFYVYPLVLLDSVSFAIGKVKLVSTSAHFHTCTVRWLAITYRKNTANKDRDAEAN